MAATSSRARRVFFIAFSSCNNLHSHSIEIANIKYEHICHMSTKKQNKIQKKNSVYQRKPYLFHANVRKFDFKCKWLDDKHAENRN